jgi:hypothetical protein
MNYDFTIKDTDTYTWAPAVGTDVADIIELSNTRMIHIDKTLPTRDKVALVGQAVSIWHMWAQMNKIPVMVSATLRSEQKAFLRILEALGFTVNGSYAFLRTQIVAEVQQPVAETAKIYTGTQR